MQLRTIQIENFMPFGPNVSYDFTAGRHGNVLLVSGPNGYGKSSLFEAVYWCLTGSTVRGIRAQDIPRLGTKRCSVVTTWLIGKRNYKVSRVWSKTEKTLVVHDGKKEHTFHTAGEGTTELASMLGFDGSLIQLVAFFGRKFNTFSRLKPADRADIIDLLARGSLWEKARTVATQEATFCKRDRLQLSNDVQSLSTFANERAEQCITLHGEIESYAATDKAKHTQLITTVTTAKKLRESATSEAQKTQSALVSLDETDIGIATLVANTTEDVTKTREKVAGLKAQLDAIHKAKTTEVCPTCGQKIKWDDKPHQHGNAAELQKQLDKAQAVKQVRQDALDEATDLRTDSRRQRQQLMDGHRRAQNDLRTATDTITKAQKDLAALDNNTELAVKKERLRGMRESIQQDEVKLKDMRKRLSTLEDKAQAAEFWSRGFKSIRYMLMETTVKRLGHYMTNITRTLGLDADEIRFSVWAQGAKAARPEIQLVVIRGDTELGLEALSEGETQRVDLACFIAFGQLVQGSLGVDIGFRVFDEPLSGLDATGKQAAFDLIHSLPDQYQRFVIDHDANFADLFENRIAVVKQDGVSTLQEG